MFSGLFGFSGRIGRGGWWFAQFIGFLIMAALIAVAFTLHDPNRATGSNVDFVFLTVLGISILAICVINICSTVKRYHDRGKSGFWFFITFVPFIGGIWQFIECGFLPGDDFNNDYGAPSGSGDDLETASYGGVAVANSSLSKLDDNYLAEYARKIALDQAAQQSATAASFGQSAKPVFGKR
jgi:uncharacterized membrane protein YhaH (DUF805 family)